MTIILKEVEEEEEEEERTTQKPLVLCQFFHKTHRFFQCLKQPEPVALQFWFFLSNHQNQQFFDFEISNN
jgi:hypothetical protein